METLLFLKSTEERFWKLEASYNYLFFSFWSVITTLLECFESLCTCRSEKKQKKTKRLPWTLKYVVSGLFPLINYSLGSSCTAFFYITRKFRNNQIFASMEVIIIQRLGFQGYIIYLYSWNTVWLESRNYQCNIIFGISPKWRYFLACCSLHQTNIYGLPFTDSSKIVTHAHFILPEHHLVQLKDKPSVSDGRKKSLRFERLDINPFFLWSSCCDLLWA